MKKLTIGMCVYNDFDGVYFTIQSLRLYHEFGMSNDVEFLVIDNNPVSRQGRSTAAFIESINNARYIKYTEKNSTSIRNQVFRNAQGIYTLCLDCHVFLWPNALQYLMSYYENNINCKDIIQGPLIGDHLGGVGYSHLNPEWGEWSYGQWGSDKEQLLKEEPFEIPMQGLGMFSCETKNWCGFSEFFQGFGGEEGYIHEKFRQNGGRTICIPQLKWVHRFHRPGGVPYPNTVVDRVWNFFVGWLELTKDPDHPMIHNIFRTFRPKCETIDQIFIKAKKTIGI